MEPNVNIDPNARNQSDLYVHEIEIDHKMGRDGVLKEIHRITVGKRGINLGSFANHYEADRLQKDDPYIWQNVVQPVYERWLKSQKISSDGLDLAAWNLTKGQVKACKALAIHTVQDLASVSSVVGDKLGPGGRDLVARAKAFVENQGSAALAAKISALEAQVAQMSRDIEERDALIARHATADGPPQIGKPAPRKAA